REGASRLDKRLENEACEQRAARDESGEVGKRRRAGIEERRRFVGRVDASRRDEIELIAEMPPRAAHIFEGGGKNVGSRESADALREACILHTTRVAVVDDA